MPAFIKPAATAIDGFTVRLTVTEASPTPTVAIEFGVRLIDANGAQLQHLAGDLTVELTAAQITAFTNAALTLYARAKTAFLT